MSMICLMRSMSSIDINVIWLLSLAYFLMRIIASCIRYTGYKTYIKDPISHVFIDNCSSCTTTGLSIILAFCLTAIKSHVIEYCETVCERNGRVYFGLKASLTLIATVLLWFLLGYGLKMCILLGYNPQIIFVTFLQNELSHFFKPKWIYTMYLVYAMPPIV